ncbi:MAG: hypothetical protein R2878_07775 [Thermoleophilia bacterium]
MGFVFLEVWPLLLAGLVLGAVGGWWCRQCLVRGDAEDHAGEIAKRDDEITALNARAADLEDVADDLQAARTRIVHLEGRTAEMDGLAEQLTALEGAAAEAEQLRGRVAELEPQAQRVEAMTAELEELRARSAELDVFRTRTVSLDREAVDLRSRITELEADDRVRLAPARAEALQQAELERDALRRRVAELERAQEQVQRAPADAERRLDEARRELAALNERHREQLSMLAAARSEVDGLRQVVTELERVGSTASMDPAPSTARPAPFTGSGGGSGSGGGPDLDAAREILGRRIKIDDLTVVEGIGPKIARLCGENGISTWRQLAAAPVTRLQGILDAAGPSYRMHTPATWPRQAELLAEGRWEAFRDLVGELRGGRSTG